MRLDKYLVDNKLAKSRTRAQIAIKENNVMVNNKVVSSANYEVKENDQVSINNIEHYVSRAAYKLLKAIDEFNIEIKNKNVLDIGSSTGGFVQVSLEAGANYIYANDVGTDQLDKTLRSIENIKVIENTNFKDIDKSYFDKPINLITCDVSFISSKIILSKIKELFNDVKIVILLKPQFEFGKERTNKHKGFVPEQYHKEIIDNYIRFCKEEGFKILGMCNSPIAGQKLGNKEYLLYLELKNEK